ncbi:MAG: hypothetical protein M3Z38_01290 [Bombilactobacillus mellifer]|nr:hypothetical protein [Bombilactobacillus mellifer]
MSLVFAHRGVHQFYPENSMASFREAISLKADGIETDVHLTKDNVPVIFHDENLKRMVGKNEYLKNLTLAEIKQFHLKKSSEKVPTLKQLLSYLNSVNYHGVLNLEIKTDQIHYSKIEDIVTAIVDQYVTNYRIIFSSFYAPSLKRIHQISNRECAYLFKKNDQIGQQLYHQGIVQSFHSKYSYIIKNNTIPLRAWTINRVRQMKICFLLDIEGIITDNYNLAKKVQNKINNYKNCY